MGLENEVDMDCVWGGWWRGVGTVVWRGANYTDKVGVEGLKEKISARWEREVGRTRRTARGGGKRLKVIDNEGEGEGE